MADAPTQPIELFVVGAHLAGQPLNHQLTDLGAAFVRPAHTETCYRLFALDTTPPKPGLLRVHHRNPGAELGGSVGPDQHADLPSIREARRHPRRQWPRCSGHVFPDRDHIAGPQRPALVPAELP